MAKRGARIHLRYGLGVAMNLPISTQLTFHLVFVADLPWPMYSGVAGRRS